MLDDLDHALLALLREDARRSYRELARLAGSTVPTVSARVRRMEDLGIIEGYTLKETGARAGSGGGLAVLCHQCKKPTSEPVTRKLDGTTHPFCCTTCEAVYVAKYERLKQGL
ncbi:MAG: AsnC family transcriptional regulator [Thermoplasmatota archaeon]